MEFRREQLKVYAITDRSWLGEQTLAQAVESALAGGATMVQLREKHLDEETSPIRIFERGSGTERSVSPFRRAADH